MILAETLFGRSLATQEEAQEKVGPVTGIPMLGLDALSSAAYGPEATLTILLPLGTMGIAWIGPLTALILALLAAWQQDAPGGDFQAWTAAQTDAALAALVAA